MNKLLSIVGLAENAKSKVAVGGSAMAAIWILDQINDRLNAIEGLNPDIHAGILALVVIAGGVAFAWAWHREAPPTASTPTDKP